jgi:hypothetical protein
LGSRRGRDEAYTPSLHDPTKDPLDRRILVDPIQDERPTVAPLDAMKQHLLLEQLLDRPRPVDELLRDVLDDARRERAE